MSCSRDGVWPAWRRRGGVVRSRPRRTWGSIALTLRQNGGRAGRRRVMLFGFDPGSVLAREGLALGDARGMKEEPSTG
jgi:hypothetical protein